MPLGTISRKYNAKYVLFEPTWNAWNFVYLLDFRAFIENNNPFCKYLLLVRKIITNKSYHKELYIISQQQYKNNKLGNHKFNDIIYELQGHV